MMIDLWLKRMVLPSLASLQCTFPSVDKIQTSGLEIRGLCKKLLRQNTGKEIAIVETRAALTLNLGAE